ncbi:MAG: 4-(cytidine 5'-diphospho)-2-C-methyl-D-erythritol kinase [Pelagimonas sp.]|jgi:4-diphosphocytidyl-2-C-methyl-D-erythritol kinase|nr:4-(cytidine 5'-diphospho)-2-C-methyl-D-erythritol kinase [Pelagimonas sp.]
MTDVTVFAPAKVNLALHVTGQRSDGYHLLDSLVMFADFGDHIALRSGPMALSVTGPKAAGVPVDSKNLCWRAATLFGEEVAITLEKNLPHAAGIGGGSSDAAAVLNGMAQIFGRRDVDVLALGADVPVCQMAQAARMSGIGENLSAVPAPVMPALLVNPGVEVPTPAVFKGLQQKHNSPLQEMPASSDLSDWYDWIARQRNDLEPPAIAAQPPIGQVLEHLRDLPDVRLARMSGSGATCFALFDTPEQAASAGRALAHAHPDWWIRGVSLS